MLDISHLSPSSLPSGLIVPFVVGLDSCRHLCSLSSVGLGKTWMDFHLWGVRVRLVVSWTLSVQNPLTPSAMNVFNEHTQAWFTGAIWLATLPGGPQPWDHLPFRPGLMFSVCLFVFGCPSQSNFSSHQGSGPHYLEDITTLFYLPLTSGVWPHITYLGLSLTQLSTQALPCVSSWFCPRGSLAQWVTFLPVVLQRRDRTKQIPAHGQGAKAGIFIWNFTGQWGEVNSV